MSSADCPPDLTPNDRRPGAGWLNRLLAYVRSLVVRVSPGGELEARRTPSGTLIHLARYHCLFAGVTSGTITARSGSTPGSGSVVLYHLRPGSLAATKTVTAYSVSGDSIAGSTYVTVGLVDGYYLILSVDC